MARTMVMAMILMAGYARCLPAQTAFEVPMPADIPPHGGHFIAGEHHYDISDTPEFVNHLDSHYISYGHHNYDMSEDPSVRHIYHHDDRHYRGMGSGEFERWCIKEKDLADFPAEPREPWVLHRIRQHGLHFRPAAPASDPDRSSDHCVFPRPSWWVIYAGKKKVTLP